MKGIKQHTMCAPSWLGLLIVCAIICTGCSRSHGEDDDDALSGKIETTSDSTDSLLHLTPEQIRLAGLQLSPVQKRDTPVTITVSGRVTPRARAEVEVNSPFPGRVVSLAPSVQIGKVVKRGETLAIVEQLLTATESVDFLVNRTQLQATVDQTEREVEHRRKEYERAQRLYQAGAIALRELQQAELDFNLAQSRHQAAIQTKAEYDSALAQSQATPRRTVLSAPINGTIVSADITPGQHVDTAHTLVTIVDLSSVWIEAHVFESDLAAIHPSHKANLSTRAYPDESFSATLVTIGNVVDATTRTVPVIFAVSNPQQKLKIGMAVEVGIPTERRAQALIIPASAVLESERPLVYVQKEPGRFEPRQITIVSRQGDTVVVTRGIRAGEEVVIAGAQQLHNEAMKAHIPIEEEGR